ncbi:MAG: Trm112 family protein [Chloroflexota bacterium]
MAQAPELNPSLLELLRCPVALKSDGDDAARLTVERDGWWLVCAASGYKYPIVDSIPQMLVDEGKKWAQTAIADLPVPPTVED